MASLRGAAGEAHEISSLGTTPGSDTGRRSEKNTDFDEKNGGVVFEASIAEDQLPTYRDHADAEETEAIFITLLTRTTFSRIQFTSRTIRP
jgi:hypothetical protein